MDYFEYRGGRLFAENVAVTDIVKEVGTPVFVYSERTLLDHYDKVAHAFRDLKPLVCYSVKSCSNVGVLRTLAQAGHENLAVDIAVHGLCAGCAHPEGAA